MDNDKLFEFMEKMYVEMQQGFKNVNSKLDSLESRVDGLEGEVKKNSLKIFFYVPSWHQGDSL